MDTFRDLQNAEAYLIIGRAVPRKLYIGIECNFGAILELLLDTITSDIRDLSLEQLDLVVKWLWFESHLTLGRTPLYTIYAVKCYKQTGAKTT